jgi:hypothetical protein
MGHFLARQLAGHHIPAKWWYEEEAGNPLVVFHDFASLRRILDDLASGNQRRVVSAVLERWREFAEAQQVSDTVTLLDGCLFGYLTWSLFPTDVPEAEIRAYLTEVEDIITPLEPCLIYFRQEDVGASLRRVLDRRGRVIEDRYIEMATTSRYGRRHGLRGFDGLVRFWTAYRDLTDGAFTDIAFAKLAVETDAGVWLAYRRRVLDFLGLPPASEETASPEALERFVGAYRYLDEGGAGLCTVTLEDGALYLDGAPQVWPHTRLLPKAGGRFDIESLPFEATFSADASGAITGMSISGPETAFRTVDQVLAKERPAADH